MTKKVLNGDELFEICLRLQDPIAVITIGDRSFDVYDTSVLGSASQELLAKSQSKLQAFFEPIIKLNQRQDAGERVTDKDYEQSALTVLKQDREMLDANIAYIAAHIEVAPSELVELVEQKLAVFKEQVSKLVIDESEQIKRVNLQRITFYAKLSLMIRQEIQRAQDAVTTAIASLKPEKSIALLASSSDSIAEVHTLNNGLPNKKKDKIAT